VDAAAFQQQTVETAEAYLAGVRATLVDKGLTVLTGVPFGGAPATWILEEIELRNADLVIMATHDRVGPDRWIHGSVAEAVVHQAPVPVMLVHTPYDAAVFEMTAPLLVVPLDGSEVAESALAVAESLVVTLGAQAALLGVVPRPGQLVAMQAGEIGVYGAGEFERSVADSRDYLESIAVRMPGAEVVVRQGDPAVEIAAFAAARRAAMVVMATHGRTGLSRVMLGSVAGGVVHNGSLPVVLLRPRELRAAEQPVPALTVQPMATA
jgi:nucleotide-binding universal stress UspA family protein